MWDVARGVAINQCQPLEVDPSRCAGERNSYLDGQWSPDGSMLERGCALLNAFMDARMMGDDDAVFTRLLSLVDAALLQHVGKASSEDFIGSFADRCGELTRVRLLECHAQVTELFYEDEAKAGGGDFSGGGDTSSGLSVSEESRAAWDKHVAACSSSLRQGWSDVIWRSMRLDDLDDNSTHPRVRDALRRCHGHAVRALAYGEAKDAHAPCSPVLFDDLSRRLDAAMSSSHTTGVGAIVEVSSWLDHVEESSEVERGCHHHHHHSTTRLTSSTTLPPTAPLPAPPPSPPPPLRFVPKQNAKGSLHGEPYDTFAYIVRDAMSVSTESAVSVYALDTGLTQPVAGGSGYALMFDMLQ